MFGSIDSPAIEFIGYVAAAFTTLAFVPQVVKVWRSQSADDLSMGMVTTFSVGVAMWLVYGLALGSTPIVAANAATLALNLLLLGLKVRHGGSWRSGRR